MTVLVTGATGYLGYNIVRRLLALKYDVCALVRRPSDVSRLQELSANLTICKDDAAGELIPILRGGENQVTVFHLAAESSQSDIARVVDGNFTFGMRLMDMLVQSDIKFNWVTAGSYWQYDETGESAPNTRYAALKSAFELMQNFYRTSFGIPAVTLVLYDTYGPGDWRNKLIPQLVHALQTQEKLELTPGEQVMDLAYISDVVDAFIVAGGFSDSASAFEMDECRFHVSGNERMTLKQIMQKLEEVGQARMDVEWSAISYPHHQIYQPCPPIPALPGWSPKVSLETGLKMLLDERG
jgi:nucleoside-diphosphate-sugar epimerase